MTWHELDVAGPVGTVPVAARSVQDPDRRVLLVRSEDGVLHATSVACPHLGQPLTHGEVDGGVLECGHHAYRYRLQDGACVGPGDERPGALPVHEVRERAGRIEVRLAPGDT